MLPCLKCDWIGIFFLFSHVALRSFPGPADCSGTRCCAHLRAKLRRTRATPSTPCSATCTATRRTAWTGTAMMSPRWAGARSSLLSVLVPHALLRWERSPCQWVLFFFLSFLTCMFFLPPVILWEKWVLLFSDFEGRSVWFVDDTFWTDCFLHG